MAQRSKSFQKLNKQAFVKPGLAAIDSQTQLRFEVNLNYIIQVVAL